MESQAELTVPVSTLRKAAQADYEARYGQARFGIIDYESLRIGRLKKPQRVHVKGERVVIIIAFVWCLVAIWMGLRRPA